MLIATRNPCPCGYAGDPSGRCNCKQASISYYQRKISGPLLDRIDIVVEMTRTDNQSIIAATDAEPSSKVAARVHNCRQIQQQRLSDSDSLCNAHFTTQEIQKYCKINNENAKLAAHAMRQLGLSARGYSRILKVARTIADLENSDQLELKHFTEALQYRPRLNETPVSPTP